MPTRIAPNAPRKHVDWNQVKKSLDRVTCIRRTHPACAFHYTEAQAFTNISRSIRETKETIDRLMEFKRATKPSPTACEKHWIAYCYECGVLGQISRSIRLAQVQLGKLRFALISLPTVANATGRAQPDSFGIRAEVESAIAAKLDPPTDRIFGGIREGNRKQPLRQSDIADNVRLIEAWLRDREARSNG